MKIDVTTLDDQKLQDLMTMVSKEQKKRQVLQMSDDELYKIAKAKNGEFSDEEALFALSILTKRETPPLEKIATLKKMSHSDAVREECEGFLFEKH